MIQFTPNKAKSLSMNILVEGIEKEKLNFVFRITHDGIEYGFPGKYVTENLKLVIPALKSVIPNLKEGKYPAKLETFGVIEENKGYYNLAWSGDIEVKVPAKIEVTIAEDTNEEVTPKAQVITEIKEEDIEESASNYTPKKNKEPKIPEEERTTEPPEDKRSKLSAFLNPKDTIVKK